MGVSYREIPTTGQGRALVIHSRVLAALDQLEQAEQAAVRQALDSLTEGGASAQRDARLRRLSGDAPISIFRAAPQVRLFVRLAPSEPVEVLDLVRPDTLQQMFAVSDPVPDRQ